MGSTVSVTAGGQLQYAASLGETNILTVTQSEASFNVADSVALTPGAGCTAVDANTATCTGVTSVRVNASNMDDEVSLGISVPSQVFGRAGADVLTGGAGRDIIEGDNPTLDLPSGDQISVRGEGPDTVTCDNEDSVQSDPGDTVTGLCTNDVSPEAEIVASPEGPTNNSTPTFTFIAHDDGPEIASYECLLSGEPGPSVCTSPHQVSTLAEGDYTFQVRAYDSVGPGPWTTRAFTVDTTPPQVTVTGPQTSTTSTPTFELSGGSGIAGFECWIGEGTPEPCASPYTTSALPNGSYVLSVRGTDAAGNATTTTFPFTVQVPTGGAPAPVQPRRIIIESLVLISGRTVKMSRNGVVSIGLQCAGTVACKGRMTITTAAPVKRRGRKLERLGSARFSIAANKRKNVKVRFSKSKRKLAKKLKRFKAKVVITEVDQRGNQRISSRVFTLRAR